MLQLLLMLDTPATSPPLEIALSGAAAFMPRLHRPHAQAPSEPASPSRPADSAVAAAASAADADADSTYHASLLGSSSSAASTASSAASSSVASLSTSSSSSDLPRTGGAQWNVPSAAALAAPLNAAAAASASDGAEAVLTPEMVDMLNRQLSGCSPREILEWLRKAQLGNVVQFTSFGLSGMVITDLLSKMEWNIPIAFIDTLYHFDEVG